MTGRQVLAWLAGLAIVTIAWLAHPFATGLLIGALMGFTLQPLHARIVLWSRRPTLSSVALVIAAGLVIVTAAVGFASAFVSQAVTFATAVREQLKPGGALTAWVETVDGWLARLGFSTGAIMDRVRAGAADIAAGSASVAGTVASVTLEGLLGLFFALLTMYVILAHWASIVTTLIDVSPLRREDTRALLDGKPRPPAPSPAEKFVLALEHAELALRLQGESRKTVIEFRKHLGWYTRGLPGASALRERLFHVETMTEAALFFQEYLEPVATAA